MNTILFLAPAAILAILMLITIIALIDIVKSRFHANDKLVWVLVVIFLNVIGAVLYYLYGRQQKREDPT